MEEDMKKRIQAEDAPRAVGPYSQGIQTGNLLYTSGQIAIDPTKGVLIEGGIEEQTRQVMENVGAFLRAAGTDYSSVIKSTVFLENIDDFGEVNEVYASFFSSDPPARSAFQVAALPLGAKIEIEMIATVEA
jgi:2-iminobutanoate/2-iminopropanoate deaminase